MLRGPQTAGELRGRTERLYQFDDLEAVDACLTRLMEWDPEPLVARLPRQVGYKEVRYAHLLSGEPPATSVSAAPPPTGEIRDSPAARLQASVDRLEAEVADLKLTVRVESLRSSSSRLARARRQKTIVRATRDRILNGCRMPDWLRAPAGFIRGMRWPHWLCPPS